MRILLRAVIGTALAIGLAAQSNNDANAQGDFYIISSVDLNRKQILLKLPTEVTELMRVDGDTRYFEENGKPLKLSDLRAGDTAYITSKQGGATPVAAAIRKGPMTLDVLRRRYLDRKK